jgi:uncharacterized protein
LTRANLDCVAAVTDTFDLGRLKLSSGEGRRLELDVAIGDYDLGGERYAVEPSRPTVVLDVSRMTGGGYSLRLRFEAALTGPCMRCLDPAAPVLEVDAREVDLPGGGEELDSPYVVDEVLDVSAWARDALALALGGEQVLCRENCGGLCPECGEKLAPGEEHEHERAPDPRWAKLRELKLD